MLKNRNIRIRKKAQFLKSKMADSGQIENMDIARSGSA